MTTIAFIGLGNMGLPMASNLVKAGHRVIGWDMVETAVAGLAAAGGEAAASNAAAVAEAEVIVTMLPAGRHVRAVYANDVIPNAPKGALFIDCSTIDVDSARAVAAEAATAGFDMLDAPVSGGTGGATAGTLTFMVGGSADAFGRAGPYLQAMGRNIVHCGDSGAGQGVKICNNMILAISMIGVSEAFVMAEKLGLDLQKVFDVTSTSSAQCWAINNYCPVPGPVPASPANRDFAPGFTAAMMLKDLGLSQDAAGTAGTATPFGAEARALFQRFVDAGNGDLDFSGIIKMIRGN